MLNQYVGGDWLRKNADSGRIFIFYVTYFGGFFSCKHQGGEKNLRRQISLPKANHQSNWYLHPLEFIAEEASEQAERPRKKILTESEFLPSRSRIEFQQQTISSSLYTE